ncbi:SLATT domain-containing protein [Actinocorallia lasiicapitis]
MTGIETSIAITQENLRQRLFYQRLLGLWLLVSLTLTIGFAWVVVREIKSFPREAQYWCFGIASVSLLLTGLLIAGLQSTRFDAERELRRLQTLRRSPGTAPSKGVDAVRARYRTEAWDDVEREREKAGRNRQLHRLMQAVVMLGSILVTALTGATAPANPTNWVIVGISISVAGAAGFSNLFRWRELSFSQQQTANEIEKQYNHLDLLIHDYAAPGIDPLQLFAERIEALKEEQRNRELQLEHSPDRGGSDAAAAGSPQPT